MPIESEDTVFRAEPADSDTAIVAFSGVLFKPEKFNLEDHLSNLDGITKLFVRDPNRHWYNSGLPGVGPTIGEVAARIEQEVDRLAATRLITIGPSMGGYAAILFGCMLEAERAIAIAPQTLLDHRLRHAPPADIELQAPDLKPFVRAATRTKIDVVAGWDDHIDVFHAQRIAAFPQVRVLALNYQLHELGRKFPRERRRALPRELLKSEIPRDCEVNPSLDPDSESGIADTAYAVGRGDWDTVAARIRPVVERYPEWTGPKFDLARALARTGEPEAAEAACRQILQSIPDWPQARALLARLMLRRGRPEEAERLVRTGIALEPEWAVGHLLLARSMARLGRSDEARGSAQRAAALDAKVAPEAEALAAELS